MRGKVKVEGFGSNGVAAGGRGCGSDNEDLVWARPIEIQLVVFDGEGAPGRLQELWETVDALL